MNIEPKDRYVDETKTITAASRNAGIRTSRVCGQTIIILPQVFDPSVFFSSCWFAEQLKDFVKERQVRTFCEIGSGTGIVSLVIGLENPEVKITTADINPHAVENTKKNLKEKLSSSQSFESNVFSGLIGKTFDVIFWSLPFGYVNPDETLDNVDHQTFDAGYESIERYFSEGASHLNPQGVLLFGFSPELGHWELIEEFAKKYRWGVSMLSEQEGMEKSAVRMQIYKAVPII